MDAAYDLLLKGGHVIDPANQISRVMDVAIQGDHVAKVAENVYQSRAIGDML